EVARAVDELHAAGKVKHFGVSNHTPRQIELLQKHLDQPIVANQLQLSITHSTFIAQGIAANMQGTDQAIVRDGGGILDFCRLPAAHDVPPEAMATAWITRHPAQMQVVRGTATPQRVTDAAAGSEVPLTRAEWYELFRAAGWIVP